MPASHRCTYTFFTHRIRLKQPDDPFRDEVNEIKRLALGVSIVSLEELGEKTCRIRPPIPRGASVVYRGWMLASAEYEKLVALIESHGATPLISLQMYLACHHLPNWFAHISELTPETKVFQPDSDLVGELRYLGRRKFFVKDCVKSLKTSIGSVISKPEDIALVLTEMQKFRGTIEGGVCVRRFGENRTPRRCLIVSERRVGSRGRGGLCRRWRRLVCRDRIRSGR
jgi:hypothetical protein